jgi:hypothetical protein
MKLQEKLHLVLSHWLDSLSKNNRDGSRTMPFTCAKSGVQEKLEVLRLEHFGKSAIVI